MFWTVSIYQYILAAIGFFSKWKFSEEIILQLIVSQHFCLDFFTFQFGQFLNCFLERHICVGYSSLKMWKIQLCVFNNKLYICCAFLLRVLKADCIAYLSCQTLSHNPFLFIFPVNQPNIKINMFIALLFTFILAQWNMAVLIYNSDFSL